MSYSISAVAVTLALLAAAASASARLPADQTMSYSRAPIEDAGGMLCASPPAGGAADATGDTD